jgi:hypothetical protein
MCVGESRTWTPANQEYALKLRGDSVMPESSSSAHAQPWNGSTKFASPATLRMFSWMNRKQRKSLPLSY